MEVHARSLDSHRDVSQFLCVSQDDEVVRLDDEARRRHESTVAKTLTHDRALEKTANELRTTQARVANLEKAIREMKQQARARFEFHVRAGTASAAVGSGKAARDHWRHRPHRLQMVQTGRPDLGGAAPAGDC